MSRKSRSRKANVRAVGRITLDPVTEQALANGAQLQRGEFEVQSVPNPHGEVMVNGEPVRHMALRRKPQFELLRGRKVISDKEASVLAWYAERSALAESGMIRNPLADNGGGGAAGVGLPITEARMGAVRDIDWARTVICGDGGQLGCTLLEVFDAVMADEISFVEVARRERANRYVRLSVRRRQDQIRDMFLDAVKRLLAAHAERFPQGPGRIVANSY